MSLLGNLFSTTPAVSLSPQESERMRFISDSRWSASTKKSYSAQFQVFSRWLRDKRPQYVTGPDGEIDLSKVTIEDVKLFFADLTFERDESGQYVGYALTSLCGLRSAIRHTLTIELGRLPDGFDAAMTDYFKGVKRASQAHRERANKPMEVGKHSLPFPLYRHLALKMLCSSEEHVRWGHAYGVLTWNLMCRTNNTERLRVCMIQFDGDALQIQLGITKTDQTAEIHTEPLNVYANPSMPEICPVLALGLHLLYFKTGRHGELFAGSSQSARFSGLLTRLLQEMGRDALLSYDRSPGDIGVHSYRKGSISFATHGHALGPSFAAICQRARWKLGIVQDSYLRFERASDQYVGRVVAGHPINGVEFACLPPHFPRQHAEADALTREWFSSRPLSDDRLFPVLRICLASIVYHAEWLRQNLAPGSQLLALDIVTNQSLTDRLKRDVLYGMQSPEMNPTGVSGHADILRNMREIAEHVGGNTTEIAGVRRDVTSTLESLREDLRSIPQDTSRALFNMQTESAISDGTVAPAVLRDTICRDMDENNRAIREEVLGMVREALRAMVALPRQPSPSAPVIPALPAEDSSSDGSALQRGQVYCWGGGFRRLPETFELPRVNLEVAWRLWWLGRAENPRLPPLKSIQSHVDLPKSQRDRFNIWRSLFRKFEQILRHRNAWVERPTSAQVMEMLDGVADVVYRCCNVRKRERAYQLRADTVEKKMRVSCETLIEMASTTVVEDSTSEDAD